MLKRTLGRGGLEVTTLGFGCMGSRGSARGGVAERILTLVAPA
jgi:hypothetical protein